MAQLAVPMMVAGAAVSASGTLAAGNAADRASRFEAAQLDQRAKSELAVASRDAAEQRRQAGLVGSRARALMAASGGGMDLGILGDIEAEGEYRALTRLWEGSEAATGARMQASASRFEGMNEKRASRIRTMGTLLQAGSSLADKYG